jgi:branched-chain amino acid transport system ATP-binding protein
MTNMLDVKDINVYYGAIHALKGLSFYVNEGEIVSLIGANGAGKTTAMHTISGLLRSKTGDILFMGDSIAAAEPHKIVRLGLAQVPEGRRVFSGMTVQENLEMGAFVRNDGRKVEKDLEMVFTRFPRLKERRRQRAGTLSGGEQQMLAIGRALMSRPKMLLLDEPSMGLSPILVNEIFDCIQEVNKSGTTILLVEQNAKMALSISHRAYVLETGKIIIEVKSSELLDNEKVKRAYLGG